MGSHLDEQHDVVSQSQQRHADSGDREESHLGVFFIWFLSLTLFFHGQTLARIRHLSRQLHLEDGVLAEIHKELHLLFLPSFVHHVEDELTLGFFDLGVEGMC